MYNSSFISILEWINWLLFFGSFSSFKIYDLVGHQGVGRVPGKEWYSNYWSPSIFSKWEALRKLLWLAGAPSLSLQSEEQHIWRRARELLGIQKHNLPDSGYAQWEHVSSPRLFMDVLL